MIWITKRVRPKKYSSWRQSLEAKNRVEKFIVSNPCFEIWYEKLHNVMGRINYIGSEAKQEHLYATYETQPREYWIALAKENRDDFFRSGTEGTCIEAREFIIALPEVYYKEGIDPNELLRYFVESFRKEYGAECFAALHHNHDMTNYHIHLIYSERDKLEKPVKKIASRNMFFDPDGRHLRTKKEATIDGELIPGYTMVPKGEVYEQHLFDKKKPIFKQKTFTEQAKQFFTDKINQPLREDLQLQMFPKNSPYLATKKIGKNNPKAKEIRETNALRKKWNNQVDVAIRRGAPRDSLMTVKQELISRPAAESIKESGGEKEPDKYNSILSRAISIIAEMCRILARESSDTWAEAWGQALTKLMELAAERVIPGRTGVRKEQERSR